MTRAIIADPDLPAKAAAGRRPRPCIGLNEGCIGRLYTGHADVVLGQSRRSATRSSLHWLPRMPRRRSWSSGAGSPGWRPRAAPRCAGTGRALRTAGAARRSGPPGRDACAAGSAGRATSTGSARRRSRAGAELRIGVDAVGRRRARRAAGRGDRSRRARSLRTEAALPGPVPVIDVDALLEGGVAVPDPAAGSALILDDEGRFSSRRPPRRS